MFSFSLKINLCQSTVHICYIRVTHLKPSLMSVVFFDNGKTIVWVRLKYIEHIILQIEGVKINGI